MKKLLLVCVVAFSASLLFSNVASAQQKIGYLDEQQALLFFPGIGKIDTLMQSYQNDSLRGEFEYRVYEFNRADSMFKKDSASMPVKAREIAIKDLTQKRATLVNWQQIGQQMYENKMESLLMPYKQKIYDALKLVMAEQKYTYVLNAQALSQYGAPYPILDNLAVRIAMKLKLPLPKEVEDAWKAASGGGVPAGVAKK